MENSKRISNKKISFILTSIYVGLATIYSLLYWTDGNIGLEVWRLGMFYFFLPASFLSIAFIFTLREPLAAILIAQLISFFIVWGPIHFIVFVIRDIVANNKK